MHYLLDKVLRFSHADFLKSFRADLGPLLGDTGLYALKRLHLLTKEDRSAPADLKKKINVATELVEKYLEAEFTVIGDEKKFNYINKFGPKKCPD